MSLTLHWKHTEDGQLELYVDEVYVGVPAELAALLEDPGGGLSANPDLDLLGAEGQLRQQAAAAEHRLAEVGHDLAATRARIADVDSLARGRRRPLPRSVRREASGLARVLAQQIHEHTMAAETLRIARRGIEVVREFVIDLEPQEGLLAEASCGWQRLPERPPFVTVFASEDEFILADERRAVRAAWGGAVLDAEMFGTQWRRDGDDTDPDAQLASRAGPWQVGYLPALGEIYALRRCHYLPEELWLLADGLDDPADTRQVLAELSERMAEPNSLILLARVLHYLARGATNIS